jgi:hypothetical protein
LRDAVPPRVSGRAKTQGDEKMRIRTRLQSGGIVFKDGRQMYEVESWDTLNKIAPKVHQSMLMLFMKNQGKGLSNNPDQALKKGMLLNL